MDHPFFQADLYDLFGTPNYGQWEQDYMRTLDLTEFEPFFSHVLDYEGNKWGCKIYANYVIHEQLHKAFSNLIKSGCAFELKSYDGCWNIRKMSGGGDLSTHSWGISIDLNAAENPYGGPVRLTDKFVRCFADAGFEWGGLWRTKDGMHFQAAWTKDWTGSTNPLAPVAWIEA